jgi:hypothetical protein
LFGVEYEAEEAVVAIEAQSEAVGDVDKSALADSDLIEAEDIEGIQRAPFTDDGSVEVASSDMVTATETSFNNWESQAILEKHWAVHKL